MTVEEYERAKPLLKEIEEAQEGVREINSLIAHLTNMAIGKILIDKNILVNLTLSNGTTGWGIICRLNTQEEVHKIIPIFEEIAVDRQNRLQELTEQLVKLK